MVEGATPSDWRGIDRRHRVGILLGAVIMLAGAGVAIALAARGPAEDVGGESARSIIPAEQTAETTAPAPSYEPGVASGDGTASAGTSVTGTPLPGTSTGTGVRAPDEDRAVVSLRVLYRREGWLCVAAPDGSGETRVAESVADASSLSPDGAIVASVGADGRLVLYDVARNTSVDVGPAEPERPSWSSDSAWLAYTAPGPKVASVRRSGDGQRMLFAGHRATAVPGGAVVAGISPAGAEPAVIVWRNGDVDRHAIDAPVASVGCSASRIYVGTTPGATGVSRLLSMTFSGEGMRTEASGTVRGVSIGSVSVSPAGAWVAYAEEGDDAYSRVYAVPADGGAAVQVSGRRDSYPLQWAGADTLMLIEGNPTHGELTSLVAASLPGGARRLVAQGAGL